MEEDEFDYTAIYDAAHALKLAAGTCNEEALHAALETIEALCYKSDTEETEDETNG